DVAHRAEQTYDKLRKDPEATWDAPLLLAELEAVEAVIAHYVDVNENKLGRKGRASDLITTRGSFVSNEQLAQVRALVAGLKTAEGGTGLHQLRAAVDGLGLISLTRIVSGVSDAVASLATELKKPVPQVEVQHGERGFNTQFAEALKSSFMHIVRNSLDHGIELPAERLRAGKPEAGVVHFRCEARGERLELRVGDDGKGLPLHKLYEKARSSGAFASGEQPSPQAVAELIFRSGVSTAERVTQVSGRGVGMDAVRTFLSEQGAAIRIELKDVGSELGFTPFEFVIDVPQSAYSFAA
ncbi:MAG TPA: ATP-binding protein, partial [Steroidobacteraceae bacterium]